MSRSQDGIQNRNRKQNAGHTSGLKVIVIESSDEEEEEDAASTRYAVLPLRPLATRAMRTLTSRFELMDAYSTSVKAQDGSQQTDVAAASQGRPRTPQHRDKQ